MNDNVLDYYSYADGDAPRKKFYKVISLHACSGMDWENLRDQVPALPRGWHELCLLPKEDRIQFTLDHWLAKLPYHPQLKAAIAQFFSELDDIGCFVTQAKKTDPLKVEMVYSIAHNRGFYRGGPPAREEDVIDLQKLFVSDILPADYLAFSQIHSGFCKSVDCTGIIGVDQIGHAYKRLQALIEDQGPIVAKNGKMIDPKGLIPFYESFGMPYYQCFWNGWYPEQEMGNVYYSGDTNSISEAASDSGADAMAFPTFLDWLFFYLEQMNI